MKSKEVVAALAEKMGWTTKEVTDMLSALGSAIGTKLTEGDTIYLSSFGQFEARKKWSVSPSTLPMENGI